MNTVFWIIALVVFLMVEASTVTMVSLWFACGALAALIVGLFAGIGWQIAVFLVVSALALACLMIGSGLTQSLMPAANAETVTVVHTSPFTAAIAAVRDSVVGVSNYQQVTYRNYGSGSYFGFPFDFGYGYGNGYQKTSS